MLSMNNRVNNKSLTITINPESTFEILNRVQSGEKLSLGANEFALLVELNLLHTAGFAGSAKELRNVEEDIEGLHDSSAYATGWFFGESRWQKRLDEAKLLRATYLLSGNAYRIQSDDITQLGAAVIAKWKALKNEGLREHSAAILKLAEIIKDLGDSNFRSDWLNLSDLRDFTLASGLVACLKDNKESRALIIQAAFDLSLLAKDSASRSQATQNSFYTVSKRYEDKFRADLPVNSMRSSILKYLRKLAIGQERGTLNYPTLNQVDKFELKIANPGGKQISAFSQLLEITRDAALPDDLERIISKLEPCRLKSELQTALDAKVRLEEKFNQHAGGSKLPVTVTRAFELMTEIAGKYLAIKQTNIEGSQVEKSLKEAEDAVTETVKRLLEATENLNYQASGELKALALALKSVVGAEI